MKPWEARNVNFIFSMETMNKTLFLYVMEKDL